MSRTAVKYVLLACISEIFLLIMMTELLCIAKPLVQNTVFDHRLLLS